MRAKLCPRCAELLRRSGYTLIPIETDKQAKTCESCPKKRFLTEYEVRR